MRLTVLGNNGPYAGPGSACSGYVIEGENTIVLLDLGNGVLSRFLRFYSLKDLSAVFLTHLHSDHMSDVMILRYAIDIKLGRNELTYPLKIYAPSEPFEEFNKLFYKNSVIAEGIDEGKEIFLGSLKFKFMPMIHSYKNYAISVEEDEKRLVYTGDTVFNENLIEFAKNADILICDANTLEKYRPQETNHISAKEAAMVAKSAGVKNLLLTHLWPEFSHEEYLNEARSEFENSYIAEELKSWDI